MTEMTKPLHDNLDPEVVERIDTSKRNLFTGNARKYALYASAPLAMAMGANAAFGQDLPQQVVDILNYALTLEHIEDVFYRVGLSSTEKNGLIPSKYLDIFQQIGLHEAHHVALLQSVIGSKAVGRPDLDLTAGGKYADATTNFDTYLTLSQTFENLGVAAYKGQAPKLTGQDKLLTTALQIHSVEARHAAEVLRIGGKSPWPNGAFDKPKSMDEVLAAAKPFIKSM